MTCSVFIATSIDGYIAREDGGLDWLAPQSGESEGDYGFGDFLGSIDAVVMGRKTFEAVAAFEVWPYEKPVFVLSTTLQNLPVSFSDRASLISGTPEEVVQSLKSRGFFRLYIDGGKTVSSFLRSDLIDEMIISTMPVVLGSGLPLFSGGDQERWFEPVGAQVHGNALVTITYHRKKTLDNS